MEVDEDSISVQKVLAGDTRAFSILIEKHKNMVFTIIIKILRSREDAEEISQDVFLKAYQSLNSFKGNSRFSTWLYRIAYNSAISKTRKKQLEWTTLDDFVINNYSEDNIEQQISALSIEEKSLILEKSLSILPYNEQLLITLFYKQEESIESISKIIGLSTANVKVKLHRLRKKIYNNINISIQEETMINFEK